MSNIVRSNELAPAVRTLLGYLDDLRRTKFDDASTKLRLVINYCQKDDVVRNLAELLRARVSSELLAELLAAETLRVPHDPRDHMAVAYTLLYHIKQGWKYELRELLTRPMFAAGAGMDGRWDSFKAKLVDALVVNGDKVLRHVEGWAAAQPDGTLVDPNDVFLAALASLAADAGPEPVPATASKANAPAAPAAPAAPRATGEPPLPDGVSVPAPLAAATGDLRVEAALLGLELSKAAPSPARLEELLASFDAAPAPLRAGLTAVLGPALVRLARGATPAAVEWAALKAKPRTKSVKKAAPAKKKPETKRKAR